jgi:hypothetical protein
MTPSETDVQAVSNGFAFVEDISFRNLHFKEKTPMLHWYPLKGDNRNFVIHFILTISRNINPFASSCYRAPHISPFDALFQLVSMLQRCQKILVVTFGLHICDSMLITNTG